MTKLSILLNKLIKTFFSLQTQVSICTQTISMDLISSMVELLGDSEVFNQMSTISNMIVWINLSDFIFSECHRSMNGFIKDVTGTTCTRDNTWKKNINEAWIIIIL
jgi:hypothetical protein